MAVHTDMSARPCVAPCLLTALSSSWSSSGDRGMLEGWHAYLGRVEVDALDTFAPGTLRMLVVGPAFNGSDVEAGALWVVHTKAVSVRGEGLC